MITPTPESKGQQMITPTPGTTLREQVEQLRELATEYDGTAEAALTDNDHAFYITRAKFLREVAALLAERPAEKENEVSKQSDFCYIDHAMGDSDHMNAHIRTSACVAERGAETTDVEKAIDYMVREAGMERGGIYEMVTTLGYACQRFKRQRDEIAANYVDARLASPLPRTGQE